MEVMSACDAVTAVNLLFIHTIFNPLVQVEFQIFNLSQRNRAEFRNTFRPILGIEMPPK